MKKVKGSIHMEEVYSADSFSPVIKKEVSKKENTKERNQICTKMLNGLKNPKRQRERQISYDITHM